MTIEEIVKRFKFELEIGIFDHMLYDDTPIFSFYIPEIKMRKKFGRFLEKVGFNKPRRVKRKSSSRRIIGCVDPNSYKGVALNFKEKTYHSYNDRTMFNDKGRVIGEDDTENLLPDYLLEAFKNDICWNN